MAQRLVDLLEQFCQYQRKQRGKAEGGVSTYRWMLERFLRFVRAREGRLARVEDLSMAMLQAWLDEMAGSDLSINTLRCRLAAVSSWCNWLVKRNVLMVNPVNKMDRPPRQWRHVIPVYHTLPVCLGNRAHLYGRRLPERHTLA